MLKKFLFIFLLATIAGLSVTTGTAFASKSNQIDENIFYDYSSMSESQIGNWISTKYPSSCLLPQNYPAEYNNPDAKWRTVTFKEPLSYFTYGGETSPARIIWRASQFYNLNPKVILTTLEKESDLVSGSKGCSTWRYNSAMGYNCWTGAENFLKDYPNIGVYQTCIQTESYAGFSPQVNKAAWQLSFDGKRANGDLSWMNDGSVCYFGRMTQGYRARVQTAYKSNCPAGYDISTYYDGYTTINGESVYLSNGPTAALYNYTPFFSRFEAIFTEWFGSPVAPPVSVTESPTSVSWANGRIDVFARGSDGGLWQKWYDVNVAGGWQSWVRLSDSTIDSAPTVSTMGPGRLDIFTKGTGGDLKHYWFAAGAWQSWESLGQPSSSIYLSSSPAAVSWANGRIDVFARGSDGGLWQKWYDVNYGGWNSWSKIGSGLTSAPSVSSWKSERLDTFARGSSGELLHYWFSKPQGWGNESLGGNIISNPASASWSEGRLDVFAQGKDGYMYQKWYDASKGAGWQGWHRFGFGLSSNPSVSSWAPGRLDLFTKGTASDLQHFWFTDSNWSSHWESLGKPYWV